MRPAALLLLAVTGCSSALERARERYDAGAFAEALEIVDGREEPESAALCALCEVQLRRPEAALAHLKRAALALDKIPRHDGPAEDAMLISLARAAHHHEMAERALAGGDASTFSSMKARIAAGDATKAAGFCDAALARARDPLEHRFLRWRWIAAQRLKARAHERVGGDEQANLARVAREAARAAVEAEKAAGSPYDLDR